MPIGKSVLDREKPLVHLPRQSKGHGSQKFAYCGRRLPEDSFTDDRKKCTCGECARNFDGEHNDQ
jgi:hypothetical protein